ncbi:MAG: NAD(P)H-binding protein [Pyrinomonadaceae bacterium]|nr:NAD(P)H-binding protein [Pyrinomonadaceae bacterium]
MKHKRLLVLGASGGCGQWVVRIAVQRGYQVTALVRPETNYEAPDGVEVVRGSVLETEVLEQAMKGQDAVISCLGIKRKSSINPWSGLASPPDFAEKSAQIIAEAMDKHDVQRLVAVSAAGVGDSRNALTRIISLMIQKTNISLSYRDLENMEEVYKKSDIDSLAVRPVTLVNGRTTDRARLVDHYGLFSRIARSDVAGWMLDALERPGPFKKASEMIG